MPKWTTCSGGKSADRHARHSTEDKQLSCCFQVGMPQIAGMSLAQQNRKTGSESWEKDGERRFALASHTSQAFRTFLRSCPFPNIQLDPLEEPTLKGFKIVVPLSTNPFQPALTGHPHEKNHVPVLLPIFCFHRASMEPGRLWTAALAGAWDQTARCGRRCGEGTSQVKGCLEKALVRPPVPDFSKTLWAAMSTPSASIWGLRLGLTFCFLFVFARGRAAIKSGTLIRAHGAPTASPTWLFSS